MKELVLEAIIDEVYNELSSMSFEDFRKELDKHKDGDISITLSEGVFLDLIDISLQ